jgi:hypothetical protein
MMAISNIRPLELRRSGCADFVRRYGVGGGTFESGFEMVVMPVAVGPRGSALRRKSEARTRARNCSGVSAGGVGAEVGFPMAGSATRDRDGKVIEGDAVNTTNVSDVWVFARDVRPRNPNWKIVATESSG